MNITKLKRVRWRRHASADSIVRAYMSGLARAAKVSLSGFDAGETSAFLSFVRHSGAWAFSDTHKRVVHYWPGRYRTVQLAHMLGHELGHIVERRGNWERRRAPRVELTADIYGAVTAVALREVFRRRGGQ